MQFGKRRQEMSGLGKTFLLVAALLLAVASQAQAQSRYVRHHFFYTLKAGADKNKVGPRLKALVDAAPRAGRPVYYQFGPDLGVARQLYGPIPGATVIPIQAAFGGYADFRNEANLVAFLRYLLNAKGLAELYAEFGVKVYRAQLYYSPPYPRKGTTVWRHQFSYAFPNRVRNGQRSTELWTKWVRAAPVKPIYTLWGTDLGWATRLYPTAPPNYDWSGYLDFKSESDLRAFWKWLFAQREYKDWVLRGPVTAAIRQQLRATY